LISFDLTGEQRDIRATVRSFVDRELIPREQDLQIRELEGGPGALSWAELRALRALARDHGLWGVETPEEFGGAGLDHVTRGLVNEELGRSTTYFSFGGNVPSVLYRADDYQQEHYLRPALADEKLACFALSEPEAGSDARAMRTRATADGRDWIVDGEKSWITNGDDADFAIVFARTSPGATGAGAGGAGAGGISAFLVDREMGWTSRPIPVMGTQRCARLEFSGVRVPGRNLLGPQGRGLGLALATINASRATGLPPRNVGASRRMLEMGVSYATSRVTFGKPLADRDNIAAMLADCDIRVRAAQAMYLYACWRADTGQEFRHEASVAKLTAARVANHVADCVLQLHGAMGYSRELPIERWYRDLRVTRIYEGADEIQLSTVAKSLLTGSRPPGGLV
jgi:acyl-CoA dehydrogenase